MPLRKMATANSQSAMDLSSALELGIVSTGIAIRISRYLFEVFQHIRSMCTLLRRCSTPTRPCTILRLEWTENS